MKRSLDVFWAREDEELFAKACAKRGLSMTFVDDCYWPTSTPPVHTQIGECRSKFVYLWNRELVPELPCRLHSDGIRFHGPQSGVVVQLVRSETRDDVLRIGTLSAGFDKSNAQYAGWVSGIFKVVDKISVPGLACVEPSTGETLTSKPFRLRAGPNAAAWVQARPGRFFRDNTVANHYTIVN